MKQGSAGVGSIKWTLILSSMHGACGFAAPTAIHHSGRAPLLVHGTLYIAFQHAACDRWGGGPTPAAGGGLSSRRLRIWGPCMCARVGGWAAHVSACALGGKCLHGAPAWRRVRIRMCVFVPHANVRCTAAWVHVRDRMCMCSEGMCGVQLHAACAPGNWNGGAVARARAMLVDAGGEGGAPVCSRGGTTLHRGCVLVPLVLDPAAVRCACARACGSSACVLEGGCRVCAATCLRSALPAAAAFAI